MQKDRVTIKINNPIEISWKRLVITASVNVKLIENGKKKRIKYNRTILNDIEGIVRPGQSTAILGPTGSGKTTLLNFLSGRIVAPNMKISVRLFLNGQPIPDIMEYRDQIAYVMQDDILLSAFTPREQFQFTARLRLSNKTNSERDEIVENLIQELGLQRCCDTLIGDNYKRGISGGERKRTSIGVELLTNPKVLFLDEPTTGLDSSTAKQVVILLKQLSQKGVNIVSTIHQPSSEIFGLFDNLILLVDGNIIYQGEMERCVEYFGRLGFACPKLFNPADYLMKLMNKEGLIMDKIDMDEQFVYDESEVQKEFDKRIAIFSEAYSRDMKERNTMQLLCIVPLPKTLNTQETSCSALQQFYLLFMRGVVNQIRSRGGLLLQTVQTIVFILTFVIIYSDLGSGVQGIQNRSGANFFITGGQGFAAIAGSLASFAEERALFLRERANNSYSVGAYFWGKSMSELPMHIFFPVLFVSVCYYWVGLNDTSISKFFISNLICILTYWYGASYGFLMSVLVSKLEVIMALMPLVILPLMVLSGLFVSMSAVPFYWRGISYISMFRYGFEAQSINEFTGQQFYGSQGELLDPLKMYNFDTSLVADCVILFLLGLLVRLICLYGLYRISNPKRPPIEQEIAQNLP